MHANYKFSVTIRSKDLAVVNCLRALSAHCQRTGNSRIPWGGTTEVNWRRNEHCVTFRFDRPDYRAIFVQESKRLLPQDLWSVTTQSDNDPAKRQ